MKIELDLSRRPDAAPAALPSLAGLSLPALKAEMEAMGVDPKKSGMRAKQLRRWIHHFGTQDFADMTDAEFEEFKSENAEVAAYFEIDEDGKPSKPLSEL